MMNRPLASSPIVSSTAVSSILRIACCAVAVPASTGFLLSGLSSPAQATIQTYDIVVDVTAGSLEGNQFTGTICYDDEFLMGIGTEEVSPYLGLSTTMNFLGKDYDQTADTDYPEYPKLILQDGEIQSLEFWVESEKRGSWWNTPGWDIQLTKRKRFEQTLKECK